MAQHPHILVVEDERNLADLYAAWLSDDYTVQAAYSGRDALDYLDDSIDVVLLDRRMPELSGDAVLTEIRERDLDCQVAMVTAVEPDFDILEMGFDDYLTKPVSRDKLTDVIESLLTRAEYNDQAQRYFRLVSKRAALETEKTPAELVGNHRYDALLEEIEDLEQTLATLTDDFTDADYVAQFHALDRDLDADPDSDAETRSAGSD